MAEMKGNKKRLPINLSFLALTDSKKQITAHKPHRNFEEPSGVVGLGILAALNNQDLIFNNGSRLMSPKSASNPIPILSKRNVPPKSSYKKLSVEKLAICEEYTCVISHVGNNLIKKREYFEADILENNNGPPIVTVSDSPVNGGGGETAAFETPNFLSSCFLCEKRLHGLDVFMYRGDTAFCSVECRYRQITIDEKKEKCHSVARRTQLVEFSVSPCSVAAA